MALYLADMLIKANPPSPLLATIYGVSWAHHKAILVEPCMHPLVLQVGGPLYASFGIASWWTLVCILWYCKLVMLLSIYLPIPCRRNAPICDTCEKYHRDINFAKPGANLAGLQTVLIIVLGFTGFLRWNDRARLPVEQISFQSTHIYPNG